MEQSQFGELFGVNSDQALQFFFTGLREVVSEPVRKEDFLYPATILAHHSQVSCFSTQGIPTPKSLRDFHLNFLDKRSPVSAFTDLESEQYEMVGAQCLLHSGFFPLQKHNMRNIRWYTEVGIRMFRLASQSTVVREREAKMSKMSDQFELWQATYYKLAVHFSGNRYLLRF